MMISFWTPASTILIFLLCFDTAYAGALPGRGTDASTAISTDTLTAAKTAASTVASTTASTAASTVASTTPSTDASAAAPTVASTTVSTDALSAATTDASTGNVNEECLTDSCRKEANSILEYMNQNVRACDDFYQFVCGKFIETHSIPDEISELNQFILIDKELNKVLLGDIKTNMAPTEIKAIQNAKNYYRNCMDEPRIEQEGTKPVLDFLDRLGGWPVLKGNDWKVDTYQWIDTVSKIHQAGLETSFPINPYIASDSLNTSKNMVKMGSPLLTINDAYFGKGVQYIEALQNFMVNVAEMLGANKDTASTDMKNCLDFEVELHKIKTSPEDLRNVSPAENQKTLKQLSDSDESINWTDLFNKILNPAGVTVEETELVEIDDPKYVSEIGKLIKRTPSRVLANYQIWQKILDLIDYLPKTFEEKKLDFKTVTQGISKVEKRETVCMTKVMNSLNIAVSAMYVRKYFNKQVKENVDAIVKNIRNQIRNNLQTITWMDDETRNYALEKLNAMETVVAYPDELLDDGKVQEYYKDLDIEPGNYLNGYINIAKFVRNANYKQLRGAKHWADEAAVAVVNAYYDQLKNKIILPVGILRDLFYQYDRPEYLNYGAVGFVIGHEIIHGFDDSGSKYDKDGNYRNWWHQATADRMKEKSQCMLDQYSEYTISEIGQNVNGKLTLGENIADNGGIKIAYKAYKKWAEDNNVVEKRLHGLNYKPEQMFWIAAARVWCSKSKDEYLRNLVNTDEHPPSEVRVVLPFANDEDFAKDFNCPLGSKMYPRKRCQIW